MKSFPRLEKEDDIIKDVRNLFRLKKVNKAIKDIKNLFEHEKDYYKPVKVGHFWSIDYIKHESNDDRNKTLSVEEYLN